MKIGELRKVLKTLEQDEMTELVVEMYKALPKSLIEEGTIDEIIADWSDDIPIPPRALEAAKPTTQAQAGRGGNVTSIAALQKWNALPEYGRELLLKNVFCSKCGEIHLKEYSVEPEGPDIVLVGKCPKCRRDVARYVELT